MFVINGKIISRFNKEIQQYSSPYSRHKHINKVLKYRSLQLLLLFRLLTRRRKSTESIDKPAPIRKYTNKTQPRKQIKNRTVVWAVTQHPIETYNNKGWTYYSIILFVYLFIALKCYCYYKNEILVALASN
jgi:hypothetical protein